MIYTSKPVYYDKFMHFGSKLDKINYDVLLASSTSKLPLKEIKSSFWYEILDLDFFIFSKVPLNTD